MSAVASPRAARMTGRVPLDRVTSWEILRHEGAAELVSSLMRLPDVVSATADALDELGTGSTITRDRVTPLLPSARVCGPVVTLRYQVLDGEASVNRRHGRGLIIGDRDLFALADPGDIAVIDAGGLQDAAVLGGLGAAWALKAGVAACVVDGAVRDSDSISTSGLPVWSSSRTGRAARYRVEAVALNAPVTISDCPVRPGDYVVADQDGVAVIPFAVVPEVVELCLAAQVAEDLLLETIAASRDLDELIARTSRSAVPD